MKDLQGKRVAVAGMAKSGLASVRLLLEQGAVVTAVDERPAVELKDAADVLQRLGVPLRPQTPESFDQAEMVVLSPGVPADISQLAAVRARAIPVIGDVELAGWFLKGPVVGITGANGKTTTTAMTGHILRESGIDCQVGGNIGTPPADMIDTSRDGQWNVLELSSFQLETIADFRARIGVALNVTPDHLDRHHTFENYAAAKGRLFDTQQRGDFAVLSADDPTCVSYAGRTDGHVVWFSLTRPVTPGAWVDGDRLVYDGETLMPVSAVPLAGRHNLENTLAASIACRLAGATLDRIAAAAATFPGVEHRLEFVRERDGVRYFNDSKATNVDAAEKAIDAFPGALWVIMGGKDKNSDYTVLRDKLRAKAHRVLLVGAAAQKIAGQLEGAVRLEHCGTIDRAVEYAAREARAGDVVVLAPACASFDQFHNYEHRGRFFKASVMNL